MQPAGTFAPPPAPKILILGPIPAMACLAYWPLRLAWADHLSSATDAETVARAVRLSPGDADFRLKLAGAQPPPARWKLPQPWITETRTRGHGWAWRLRCAAICAPRRAACWRRRTRAASSRRVGRLPITTSAAAMERISGRGRESPC